MILLLSEVCPLEKELSKHLCDAGIPLFIASPDAGEGLLARYDVGGVILNGSTSPLSADALCLRLLATEPAIPIALLLPQHHFSSAPAARILRIPMGMNALCSELLAFCVEQCGCMPSLGTYALSLASNGNARYLGYSVCFSPREVAILRLLLFRAPHPVRASELLSVCFPEGTQRASVLAAHVSSINSRVASISPDLPLIENVFGFGYRLRDGIVGER